MSGKVTIDLKAAAAVIGQSFREVLDAHGINLCRLTGSYADIVHGQQEIEDLYRELGNNTAACLAALEDEPEPSADECRHSDRLIRLDGSRKCRDCDAELAPVASPVFAGPKRAPVSKESRGRR